MSIKIESQSEWIEELRTRRALHDENLRSANVAGLVALVAFAATLFAAEPRGGSGSSRGIELLAWIFIAGGAALLLIGAWSHWGWRSKRVRELDAELENCLQHGIPTWNPAQQPDMLRSLPPEGHPATLLPAVGAGVLVVGLLVHLLSWMVRSS